MFADVPSVDPFSYVARIPFFICALKETLFMFVLRETLTAKRTKIPDGIVMTELETNCSVGEGLTGVEIAVPLTVKIVITLEIRSCFEAVVATSNDAIVSVRKFCTLREVKDEFCEVSILEEAYVNKVLRSVVADFITRELVATTKNPLERFPLEEGVAKTFIDGTAVYLEVCDTAKLVVCVRETLNSGVALDCSTRLLVAFTGLPSLEKLEIVDMEADDNALKLVVATRNLLDI